jgi:hypothetical protein
MTDLTVIKSKFDLLRPAMDERTCCLWAASEACVLGAGGEAMVSAATGLSRDQIRAGAEELDWLAVPLRARCRRYPDAGHAW